MDYYFCFSYQGVLGQKLVEIPHCPMIENKILKAELGKQPKLLCLEDRMKILANLIIDRFIEDKKRNQLKRFERTITISLDRK